MKKLILSLLGIALIYGGSAQTNLDSLYAVWQDQSQIDTSRAEAFNRYIESKFLYTKPDTAAILAEQLIEFSIQNKYKKGQATGFQIQGTSFYLLGNYDQAINHYKSALALNEEMANQYGTASSLNNIGIMYKEKGDYPQALTYYFRSNALFEISGNQKGVAASYSNIGVIHQYQGDYSKALDFYERSLVTYEKIENQKGIILTLNNIGLIYKSQGDDAKALEYFERALLLQEKLDDQKGIALSLNNIGLIYDSRGELQTALEYFENSLSIRENIGDQKGIAASLGNIGVLYKNRGDYSNALSYLERALIILEKIGDQKGMTTSITNIGQLHVKQGNSVKGIEFCKKSLELAEKIGLLREQKSACECLYDTYKIIGKGNDALVYIEKIQVINDSLKTEETAKKLQQMEFQKLMLQDSIAKAEEARIIKEAHQAEVHKKNQTRNMLLGSSFLLLLVVAGLYSRWRFVQKSKAALQIEKDRSENLLLNILPEEIANELKEKGRADARDFDMVSILFTDFKGFTEASAKLSAQDLVAEINTCFEAFDQIMEKYGIEKIKTIGDAYMAAGGLPIPTNGSVKNTVMAALEMQDFIVSRKIAKSAKGEPAFEMRVGIHTGPVVAGIVGIKKFQYDIWGDTVNTASRMESSGEVGKVNISEATYELVKDQFSFEFRGEIEAKGKGKLGMYFVSEK